MYKMKEIRRAIRRDRDLRGMVVKSGAKDAILLDVTEDKMPDIALLDTTGDGYVDAVALDLDGNGYFDTLLADTDGNDVPDTVILGDLDNGTIREVIRGEDVEDAIIDAVNLIVSAVMLDLFTAAAADALAEEVCAQLDAVGHELEEGVREAEKAEKKAALDAKRVQRAEDRANRMEELKAKIKGMVRRR